MDNAEKLVSYIPKPDYVISTPLNDGIQKIHDINNASYVDGFFSFLSNQLVEGFNFLNGVRYYGSFLSIKKDFMFNIADDLDYLVDSKFFNSHQNTLFQVQDYTHIIEAPLQKPRLNFDNLQQLDENVLLDDVIELDQEIIVQADICESKQEETNAIEEEILSPIENTYSDIKSKSSSSSKSSSTKSFSTISSRSSQSSKSIHKSSSGSESESGSESGSDSGSEYGSEEEEEQIYATLSQFPVQLICLEKCVDTLGYYLDSKKIDNNEWFAILMQIIMTLIVYQKSFHFTHNDLHTNNIMYVFTKQKFIYYRHAKQLYKVPTYGKIYKIIDFGRAIFNYRGHRFCSDSFKKHGDAHSQYNTEPYYEPTKSRIDPNYSFDLCRLACTLFDDLLNSEFEGECTTNELISKTTNPVAKLIAEWCTSDDGKNILYKDNGDERYPDFKLYKMIARRVHKHIPTSQLLRPEFKKFMCPKNHVISKDSLSINIDAIECYV